MFEMREGLREVEREARGKREGTEIKKKEVKERGTDRKR